MTQFDNPWELLSAVNMVMGLANYDKNVTQDTISKQTQDILESIHKHLMIQDDKIDKILEVLDEKD